MRCTEADKARMSKRALFAAFRHWEVSNLRRKLLTSDQRIWVAVIIGSLVMLSAVGWREITNAQSLAAQVQSEQEARRQSETYKTDLLEIRLQRIVEMQAARRTGEYDVFAERMATLTDEPATQAEAVLDITAIAFGKDSEQYDAVRIALEVPADE